MEKNAQIAVTGATTVIAESALALSHAGGLGVIVGLGAGALAYWLAGEMQDAKAGEYPPPSSADEESPAQRKKNGELSLMYRLTHGKSVRGEPSQGDQTTDDTDTSQQQTGLWVPPQFRLDDVLNVVSDFNQQNKLYFGDTEEGAAALKLSKVYHVMDVASSGNGKSNRFRLAMMQTVTCCETYYINPLAANVKLVDDERRIEVWKPIYDRLANGHPVKEGEEIGALMKQLVDEINDRAAMEEQGDFSWQARPIFVFIDELPEVGVRCPDAIKYLDAIGRMGRQFFVFTWVASQSALVSEIKQSTAAQANYKTRIYGGGDTTSAGRMMKGKVPADVEKTLSSNGAGLTLMLAEGMQGTSYVRAPLVTNEALFLYLGLPPFRMEDWIKGKPVAHPTRRLPETEPFPALTLLPKPQNTPVLSSETIEEKVKGKSSKRVKGPNDDAILAAMDEIEEEDRPLTLNSIAKRAGLTRHQYDDIEELAAYYGYSLTRGTGRPATKESVR